MTENKFHGNNLLLTCDCDSREHPALSVFNRALCEPEELHDADTPGPLERTRPISVVSIPSALQDAIVIRRIDLLKKRKFLSCL